MTSAMCAPRPPTRTIRFGDECRRERGQRTRRSARTSHPAAVCLRSQKQDPERRGALERAALTAYPRTVPQKPVRADRGGASNRQKSEPPVPSSDGEHHGTGAYRRHAGDAPIVDVTWNTSNVQIEDHAISHLRAARSSAKAEYAFPRPPHRSRSSACKATIWTSTFLPLDAVLNGGPLSGEVRANKLNLEALHSLL